MDSSTSPFYLQEKPTECELLKSEGMEVNLDFSTNPNNLNVKLPINFCARKFNQLQ